MLSLSTIKSKEGVNLMFDVDQTQAEELIAWMEKGLADDADPLLRRTLAAQGLDRQMLTSIRQSFIEEEGFKHGINVGYLDGAAGKQAFHTITDLLQGLTRDSDKIPFRVGLMNTRAIGEAGQGIITVGAAILDRLKTPEERAAYKRDLGVAAKRTTKLEEELPNFLSYAKAKAKYSMGSDVLARRAEAIHKGIRKGGPLALGAAALVFGGYYGYKRHKEQQTYDEALETMPTQDDQAYASYREEMGLRPAPAVKRMDAMATAGIVGNLHSSAVGHSSMNPNRNAGLFSAV